MARSSTSESWLRGQPCVQHNSCKDLSMSFQYVQPIDEQKELMQSFRDKYEALAKEVATVPPSRGVSLAMTRLEESAFWLNKAITNNC